GREDGLGRGVFREDFAELEGLGPGRDAMADRQHLDYVMVYVSKANMVGMRLADMPHPPGCSLEIVQVRRGDADILPRPDLTLEYGDRLGLVINPQSRPALINHFAASPPSHPPF